jgi:hypothetical protein
MSCVGVLHYLRSNHVKVSSSSVISVSLLPTLPTFTGTLPDNVQQLHVRQPSTYAKPEAACAVLGS